MKRVQRLGAGLIFGVLLTISGCGLQLPNQQSQTSSDKANAPTNTPNSQTHTDQIQPNVTSSSVHSAIKAVKDLIHSVVKNSNTNNQTKSKTQTQTNQTAAASDSQQVTTTGTTPSSATQSNKGLSPIAQHLLSQDSQFSVPITSSGSISDAFKQAMAEVPYIHWNISSYKISSNGETANITVDYRENKSQTEFVDTRVHQILASILKPGMTNVYKEYVIHNWIVSHLQYDTSLKIDTAYDALKSGRTVCQGYALLAYRMLTTAGIPTKIETGSVNGESHMWDEVNIGGKWYQLDPTWDDPVGDGPNDLLYTYFNVTNQELAYTHQWNEKDFPISNTDFVAQLKSMALSDSQHSTQYHTILAAIGANLPLAHTPQDAHQQMQQAIQSKKGSVDFIIQSTQANASNFMNQAEQHLVTSVPVSFQYSTPTYVRKGQNYCRVHVTFKY